MLSRSESTPGFPGNSDHYLNNRLPQFFLALIPLTFSSLKSGMSYMSICIVLLYNPPIPSFHNIHSSGINESLSLKKKFKMISTTLLQGNPVVITNLPMLSRHGREMVAVNEMETTNLKQFHPCLNR